MVKVVKKFDILATGSTVSPLMSWAGGRALTSGHYSYSLPGHCGSWNDSRWASLLFLAGLMRHNIANSEAGPNGILEPNSPAKGCYLNRFSSQNLLPTT